MAGTNEVDYGGLRRTILAVVIVLLGFANGGAWVRDWFKNQDDARLDRLREATVQACGEGTLTAEALRECVQATIEATGQKT